LRAISALAREPGITAGYSDHTLGIEAAVLSVALGARIIEKHFTRDKQHSDFHDHRISADPRELRLLVERVREAEAMLGSGTKIPQAAEMATREKARRSVAAARTLEAGALIGWEDITWLRPAGGFPPGSEGEVVGRRAAKRIPQGHRILREHLD
jgi:sialic acid synthase SpsE